MCVCGGVRACSYAPQVKGKDRKEVSAVEARLKAAAGGGQSSMADGPARLFDGKSVVIMSSRQVRWRSAQAQAQVHSATTDLLLPPRLACGCPTDPTGRSYQRARWPRGRVPRAGERSILPPAPTGLHHPASRTSPHPSAYWLSLYHRLLTCVRARCGACAALCVRVRVRRWVWYA